MSDTSVPRQPNKNNRSPAQLQSVFKALGRLLERLYRPFLGSFLPEPHYLEGETVKQVIRMASYRARVPRILGVIGIIVLVPALVAFLVTLSLQTEVGQLVSGTFTIVSLLLLLEAGQGWLAYNQWQFILTDKRIILITPDPDRRGFADVIYLKQKIQVLDTNFSSSPIWGLFQILQGSRDVMLSLGGYEFQEQGAKVKGGLRFPDVRPEDISQLEVLIFG